MSSNLSFASRHHELVWSNSRAGEEVYLRAALLRPHFHTIIDACRTFGLAQVSSEWQALAVEDTPEARRAAPAITRMLRNIELGLQHATR